MASYCNTPPAQAAELPFLDFLALTQHCESYLKIKSKHPEW